MFTHPLFTFLLRINQQIYWREHEEIHNSKKLYNMEPLQELICEIVSRKGFTRVQFIFYWVACLNSINTRAPDGANNSPTCKDMKPNCSCFEDGGFASVVSGVGRTGIPDRRVGCRNEFQGFVGLVHMQNPFLTDLFYLMIRWLCVSRPFSVTTVMPPRGDSYDTTCKKNE